MSFGKAVKQVLGTVAPNIARAIGGPFGGLAAAALQAVFPGDSEAEISRKLAEASPETLLALKNAEMDMTVRMRELDISEDQLYLVDTADARAFAKETSITPQVWLTIIFLGIYAGMLYIFFTVDFELNDWQRGQMGILIGVVTTAVVQIINFWFGSSKGSKDKTAQLGRDHGSNS